MPSLSSGKSKLLCRSRFHVYRANWHLKYHIMFSLILSIDGCQFRSLSHYRDVDIAGYYVADFPFTSWRSAMLSRRESHIYHLYGKMLSDIAYMLFRAARPSAHVLPHQRPIVRPASSVTGGGPRTVCSVPSFGESMNIASCTYCIPIGMSFR